MPCTSLLSSALIAFAVTPVHWMDEGGGDERERLVDEVQCGLTCSSALEAVVHRISICELFCECSAAHSIAECPLVLLVAGPSLLCFASGCSDEAMLYYLCISLLFAVLWSDWSRTKKRLNLIWARHH